MNKLIIIVYFGELPPFSDYFFQSCKYNKGYDFILLNDTIVNVSLEDNIRKIPYQIEQFNASASTILGVEIALNNGFKISDLRPAFGLLFKEYLQDYQWWGFCDLDIILGNLNEFIPETLLNKIDIYSSKPKWNSGSFSLYRNVEEVNHLFQKTNDWKLIFTSNNYFGFDECSNRWDGKPVPIDSKRNKILSIYDLIHSNDNLTAYYDDVVIEWPEDIRALKWKNGKWINLVTGKSFMYLHIILMKKSWRFYQPQIKFSSEVFVTGLGLSNFDHRKISFSSIRWYFLRFFYCIIMILKYRLLKLSNLF